MKLYIGVNSDGSEIISKQPLKRYISYDHNQRDLICYNDVLQPPHWMPDYSGVKVGKFGLIPVGDFITLPSGSIKKLFGESLTWEDESKTIEL
jgi:hypothetical protein